MYLKLKIFDPDFILDLILALYLGGYVQIPSAQASYIEQKQPLWQRLFLNLSKLMQINLVVEDNNTWLTQSYSMFVRYFYNPFILASFAILALVGFIIFIINQI